MTANYLNKNVLENLNKKSSISNMDFSAKDNYEFNINEIPVSHEAKKESKINSKNVTPNYNNISTNSIANTPSNLNILNESITNNQNFRNTFNNNFNNNVLNNNKIINNNSINYPILEILPEISFSYNPIDSASFLLEYTEYKNSISIAYPLDLELRSRNMPQFPYILVTIYLNYDMKFKLDLFTPNFIDVSYFKNSSKSNEFYDLKNFEYANEKYEKGVFEYFRDMSLRETIINKIINLNLGLTLEIDSSGFRKFSQYIHFNDISSIKRKIDINYDFTKKGSQNMSGFSTGKIYFNLVVCYNFDKENNKVLQVSIIDTDKLSNIASKKFAYSNNDLDDFINNIFNFLLSNINNKLNQST